jgi:hypothetical protein
MIIDLGIVEFTMWIITIGFLAFIAIALYEIGKLLDERLPR